MIAQATNISGVRIADFCQTGSGGTPSRTVAEYFGGTIPWVKSGELRESVITSTEEHITQAGLQNSAAKLLPKDTLLVALYGATVGRIGILGIEATTNQAVCHIIPNKDAADVRYLFYALQSKVEYWLSKRVGGGQPNISQGVIKDTLLPLPPLAEQKRIAEILDAAEALRAKRREALAELEVLLQATFFDLFGDPSTNPKEWNFLPIGKTGTSFEGGKNYNPTDEERLDGLRVLKVSAVTSGTYLPHESKPFAESETVPSNYRVRDGDLLISRANTSELVGAVVHVRKAGGREVLPDKLWRFLWAEPSRIEPLYMLHVARSKYFRRHLIQRATGTSGSMKNIGKEKMLGIPIPLPPIALQRQFASVVELIDDQKEIQRAHLTELDALFASLQSRAFRGEL